MMKRAAIAGISLAFSIVCSNGILSAQGVDEVEDSNVAPSSGLLVEERAASRSLAAAGSTEDDGSLAPATLELRLTRQTCRGVAHLSQIAQKCQTLSSAPLIRE